MSISLALPQLDLSHRPDDGLDVRRARARLLAEISGALADLGRDPRVTTWRSCPVCAVDEPSKRPVVRAPVFDFHRCAVCSLLYTPRLLHPDVVRERYQDTALGRAYFRLMRDETAGEAPESHAPILDRVLDYAPSRVAALDVGCGFGALAAALRPRFDEILALELDNRVAEVAARRHEIPVRSVRIEDLIRSDESVDAVTFHGTLERVADVGSLLDAAHRLLRPGGAIYVGVAHGASVGMNLLGGAHPMVAAHRLVQLFTVDALRTMVRLHGFVVRNLVVSDDLDVSAADWALARVPNAAPLGLALDRVVGAAARRWRLPSRHGRGARLELVATKGPVC